MKTVKVISDLHLGAGKEDDFYFDDEKFAQYINRTCISSLLVINGDLFDIWEGLEWADHKKKFLRIIGHHPKTYLSIIENMRKQRLFYINGNHDVAVRAKNFIDGVLINLSLIIDNVSMYFEHGHAADIYNSKYYIVGKFMTWVSAWIERLFYRHFDEHLRRMYSHISGRDADEQIYTKYASQLMDKNGANIICLGHTHRTHLYMKTIDHNKSSYYVNSGKSCDTRNYFDEVEIIINNEKFEIKQNKVSL